MHICYDRQGSFTASLPYRTKTFAVKFDDAMIEASRIDIVVIQEFFNSSCSAFHASEQECSALAPPFGACGEHLDALTPYFTRADELRRPACRRAPYRLK